MRGAAALVRGCTAMARKTHIREMQG
jgi:hypothetical protein